MHRHHHDPSPEESESTAVSVDITLLGGFRVAVDGVPTTDRSWARRSAADLVKVLALAPGHHLHREQVMDLLWPDDSPDRAAPRLHKAAHFARRATGCDDAVVLRRDVVWLFPDADVTVDAIRFEELARVAIGQDDPAAARDALSWYRGDLLPDDPYEDWALDRRELLHLRQLDLLRVAGGWRDLAEIDPTDEEAHLALMDRHLAAGDGSAALREHEHFERILERELDLRPGDEAERARRAATRLAEPRDRAEPSAHVDELLVELADVVRRGVAVLAELAAAGAVPEPASPTGVGA